MPSTLPRWVPSAYVGAGLDGHAGLGDFNLALDDQYKGQIVKGCGAHYFLFGRVDEKDPPGVLRESGFGVEFPNYVVDVQKDENGEYKEAIQFQCLERGGVRVFEGINFMSRNPVMTDQELTAMHARAEKAGMYPYGASPEQMHTVARRDVNAPELTTAGNECGNSSVLISCWSCSQKALKMEEDRSLPTRYGLLCIMLAKCTFIFYGDASYAELRTYD